MIDVITGSMTDNLAVLAFGLVMFIAGALCPTYYATERMRGFGREVVSHLPYRPPPGMGEEEALEEAADE